MARAVEACLRRGPKTCVELDTGKRNHAPRGSVDTGRRPWNQGQRGTPARTHPPDEQVPLGPSMKKSRVPCKLPPVEVQERLVSKAARLLLPCREPLRPRRQNIPAAVAVETRARRASDRKKSRAVLPIVPGRTEAELMIVTEPTWRSYVLLLMALAAFMLGDVGPRVIVPPPKLAQEEALEFLIQLQEDEELDEGVASFINATYWQGESGSLGMKVRAALSWLLPRFQKEGIGRLPRTAQAARGTSRRAPGQTRLPLPECVMYAVPMVVAWQTAACPPRPDAAVALMIALHCYLRPREMSRMLWSHIVGSRGAGPGLAALLLHPSEEIVTSKTGENDETIIIDLPWLAILLERLKRLRPANETVAGCPASELRRLILRAFDLLLLHQEFGQQNLYVIRHSGVSADWLRARRTRRSIQDRGRWRAATSMRRYEKGGRAAE